MITTRALKMVFAFACAAGASSAVAADTPPQTFYQSISENPTSLFPLTNNDGDSEPVTDLLFENLLDRHWDTHEWMPKLASKWEISPDGKQFTFWLDPRAKFQDGTPVTVDDVKFSYDIIFMKDVHTAPLRPYYENIEGVTIVAPGQVRFTAKNVYFKNFDVCAGLMIIEKKHYSALLAKDPTMTKAEVTKSPMGTSEWKVEKWDDNQQIVMVRDDNYWDKSTLEKNGQWNVARRVFRIIPDTSVEYETFRKGDLTMHGFQPKQWALNSDGPEFKTKITKVQAVNKTPKGYMYLGWNNEDPLLKDKNVRWGLSHLVNLPLWIKKFDFNLTEATVGPFNPNSDENDPGLKPVTYSTEEARQAFAKAGWTKAGSDGVLVKDGKRFELEIIYPTQAKESDEPKLTEFKNTAAKIGVSVSLKAVEWTSFTKLLDEHKFQGVMLAWGRVLDDDPKQIWHSASIANQGSNYVSYKNPAVDKLIDEYRASMERPKRVELARQIQKAIYDDQPYTFLTQPRYTLYGHQNYVKKKTDTYNYTVGTSFWQLMQPAM